MKVRRPALRHSITRRRAAGRRRIRDAGRRGDRSHGGTPWLTLAATLPGLAALVALLFNWVSVNQTRAELQIAEQEQYTTRFNVAVMHLGSSSADVRFGGIYALERIMQDSPRDQPRIIAVLSAYVRTHASVPADGFPRLKEVEKPPPMEPDVTAVTEVLAERPPGRDGRTKINWKNTDLRGLELQTRRADKEFGGDPSAPRHLPFAFAVLSGADLQKADLMGVDLHGAEIWGANLAGANLLDVKLSGAFLWDANLTTANLDMGTSLRRATLHNATLVDAVLAGVDLTEADLYEADLTGAQLTAGYADPDPDSDRVAPTNLTDASLAGANLTRADLGPNEELNMPAANLTRAYLSGANCTGADLTNVNLTRANLGLNEELNMPAANLTRANLTRASLNGANLTGANLEQANLKEANLEGANLKGANLKGANLKGANLKGANLKGANLKGANLKGASTDKAVGLPPLS